MIFELINREKCGINQAGPVRFLVEPQGRWRGIAPFHLIKVLFPILNTECSYSETPTLKMNNDARKCAVESDQDAVLKASLDNHEIKSLDNYRVTSSPFNVTYPSDPVFPTNSNFSQAVSDGWFIMLEPLKPGTHELKFSASQWVPELREKIPY